MGCVFVCFVFFCVFWCFLVFFGVFWCVLVVFKCFWVFSLVFSHPLGRRLPGPAVRGVRARFARPGAGQSAALRAARAQRAQQRPGIGTDNVGCAGDGLLRWAGRPVGATARAQRGAGLRTQRAAARGGV